LLHRPGSCPEAELAAEPLEVPHPLEELHPSWLDPLAHRPAAYRQLQLERHPEACHPWQQDRHLEAYRLRLRDHRHLGRQSRSFPRYDDEQVIAKLD